jgi:hypothetical protein
VASRILVGKSPIASSSCEVAFASTSPLFMPECG